MKEINIDVAGLGAVVLKEPTISQVKPFLSMMGEDTQGFLISILDVCVFDSNGKHIPDVTSKVGLSALVELTPKITELMGFDTPGEDEGED